MSKNKTTEWFVNGEKPAYVGVYNVSCQRTEQSGTWYSYWNGKAFQWFASSVESAYLYNKDDEDDVGAGASVLTEGSWRGLANNPKG